LNNLGRDVPIWSLVWDYWPLLLVFLGVVGLVEVLYHVGRGGSTPPRSFAGGGILWLLVLFAFFGWVAHRHNIRIGPFTNGGVNILGSDYTFDVNATGASQGVARVVLDNINGNLSLKGEDGGDVKVSGRRTIRSFSRNDADRANQQSSVHVDRQGDLLVIRADDPNSGSRMLSVTTDLDITLPRSVDLEARGRSGDLTIDDMGGSVNVISGRGDVRLSNIGKDVKIESSRNGLIRASAVKGNIDLEGRGGDIQIDDVQGQVTVNGEFSGSLEFRALAKPLHFQSQRSDLHVEKIPGSVTLDLGELKADNLVGPVRLKSRSKDIHMTDVSESLELDLDQGDVEVIQTKMPVPRIDLRTHKGNIALTLPENASFDLEGQTRQGDINNNLGDVLKVEQEGRGGTIKGKAGNNGPSVRLNADRGSLTVRKN
jgi:hypothetical protein